MPGTRETPRELLPKLPPSRGSSQNALAGTPVPKHPYGHSGPDTGPRPGAGSLGRRRPEGRPAQPPCGNRTTPCGARSERHGEPLPTLRGVPDCSGNTQQCTAAPGRRQPKEPPGFRGSGDLFALPGDRFVEPGDAAASRPGARAPRQARKGETPRKPWPKPQPPRGPEPSAPSTPCESTQAVSRRAGLAALTASHRLNRGPDAGPAATERFSRSARPSPFRGRSAGAASPGPCFLGRR
jgi:hypothetical protein